MKISKKAFVLLMAMCLMMTGLTVGYANSYKKPSIRLADGTTFSGGVIRIDPSKGVYLHTNDTHHSRGIKSVRIDSKTGGIRVTRDKMDAIISVSADADETLSERKIVAGISGGGVTTIIFLYKDGRKLNLNNKNDYKLVASPSANLWVQWISEPR